MAFAHQLDSSRNARRPGIPTAILDDVPLAPSKHGVQINPLTPEQNQFAPEGSRAWLWARGELSSAPQKDVAPPRHRRRLRTLAKAKALRILYRLKGR